MKPITFLILLSFLSTMKGDSPATLTLPFTRNQIPEPDASFPYNYIDENEATVEIKVGSPLQSVKLLLKSEEYSTVLLGQKVKVDSKDQKYSFDKSSTYGADKKGHDLYSSPYELYSVGKKSNDTFNINGKDVPQINFMLSNKIKGNIHNGVGVLGNARFCEDYYDTKIKDVNLIDQLVKKKVVNSPVTTFKFTNGDNGDFVIGAYPHEYGQSGFDKNNLMKLKLSNNFPDSWVINVDDVKFGDQSFENENKKFATFNFEMGYIGGTTSFHKLVYEKFFEKAINDGLCHQVTNHFNIYYYCVNDKSKLNLNNMPNLNFYVKQSDFTFTLTPDDLFVPCGDKLLYLVTFDENFLKVWNFGLPFFKKYQVTLDRKANVIGIYKNTVKQAMVNNGKNINDLLYKFGIIGFLAVIFAFAIIFSVKGGLKCKGEKKRQKRKNELEDDFIYLELF